LAPDRIVALEHFLDLLQRWNRVYNLTAVRDPQEMLVQHLLDALAIIPILGEQMRGTTSSQVSPLEVLADLRIADLGSGAGIPGLVLALACPELHLLSIEPVGKKCAFQRQVVSESGLAYVEIKQARAEEVRQACDLVMCRALTSLAEFIRISSGLIDAPTRLCALKGRRVEIDAELSELPSGWNAEVLPVKVPGLDAERHLVLMHRAAGGLEASPQPRP
jgi:16S rRNA (guanine527-N7)-methyltransferase